MYQLGIDVGGTNIDFAVVDAQGRLLYGHKILAEGSLHKAIACGLDELRRAHRFNLALVSAIHLGTTLAVNSLLELKSLYKVGLLRLAAHEPDFPPAYFWPPSHREAILAAYRTISGGREYNGLAVRAFNKNELLDAVRALLDEGAESLALISVFSPLYAEDELRAAELIRNEISAELPLSLSSQLGSLGFIERENTTVLNAALKKVLAEQFHSLGLCLKQLGFKGECYITQNNGTLFTVAEAIEFPVKTISSGPTNSLIGACKLAQCKDAVVVDIGGTSVDIGMVEQGFPLYSLKGGMVAGISCNLLVPDIISLAMGGGSIVRWDHEGYRIGPESLGAELFKKCRTSGGPYLTLYDLGQELKAGNSIEAKRIMSYFVEQIKKELRSLLPDLGSRPVLLVGGGSENIPNDLLDTQFIRPPNYQIANAYGAALSEIAGHIDCILDIEQNAEKLVHELEEKAKALAVQKGASANSVRIVEKKILPLYYLDEPKYRVLITAAGPLCI